MAMVDLGPQPRLQCWVSFWCSCFPSGFPSRKRQGAQNRDHSKDTRISLSDGSNCFPFCPFGVSSFVLQPAKHNLLLGKSAQDPKVRLELSSINPRNLLKRKPPFWVPWENCTRLFGFMLVALQTTPPQPHAFSIRREETTNLGGGFSSPSDAHLLRGVSHVPTASFP